MIAWLLELKASGVWPFTWGMITMYLSASEELAPVESVRATLRALARRTGKRYAQAKDSVGRVVATVEV